MAEEAPPYDELRIRFHRAGEGRYRTVATAADDSTASATFEVPFSELELDNFVLRVGRQRLARRSYRSKQMDEARRLGERLFDALMVEEVRDIFRAAHGAAESAQRGLRLTLCLSDVPELMELPWEFLYERPRFLSQSIYSPVARSLDLRDAPMTHPLHLPLNVLGLVSAPSGIAMLDVEQEKAKLTEALRPLSEVGMVNLEWLDRGTLQELDVAINRQREPHVFHFVGHGGYDSRDQSGVLILENEHGDPHEVSGEELGLLLQDERSLKLAVLNACEGARSSHVDPFSGAAASLVHYGVPAVIGMQFEITDKAAIAFAERLYGGLARGFPVDAALAQARRSIFAGGTTSSSEPPSSFCAGRAPISSNWTARLPAPLRHQPNPKSHRPKKWNQSRALTPASCPTIRRGSRDPCRNGGMRSRQTRLAPSSAGRHESSPVSRPEPWSVGVCFSSWLGRQSPWCTDRKTATAISKARSARS